MPYIAKTKIIRNLTDMITAYEEEIRELLEKLGDEVNELIALHQKCEKLGTELAIQELRKERGTIDENYMLKLAKEIWSRDPIRISIF